MIGIMGAIPEEISAIVSELMGDNHVRTGMRDYHVGTLWGAPVVAVYSRVGKVAAALTATHLISHFNVDQIIFTGVAGGVSPTVNVGDIVVAGDLFQHDMDARPLFERHVIPLLGQSSFCSSASLRARCLVAATEFLGADLESVIASDILQTFGIVAPKAIEGGVASGDKFFNDPDEALELSERLPVSCVEMEGAAVAQVCHEYAIDYAVIRTISDSANAKSHVDFTLFIQEIAAVYSRGIVKRLLTAQ